jgi:hypothetical protein
MSTSTYESMTIKLPEGLESAVRFILANHVGRLRAIGREALTMLVREMGIQAHERQVRMAIHELRRGGLLICSAPGEDGGYYLAANLQEFDEFIECELHPKAIDMLETEKAMRNAARQQFGEASQPGLMS